MPARAPEGCPCTVRGPGGNVLALALGLGSLGKNAASKTLTWVPPCSQCTHRNIRLRDAHGMTGSGVGGHLWSSKMWAIPGGSSRAACSPPFPLCPGPGSSSPPESGQATGRSHRNLCSLGGAGRVRSQVGSQAWWPSPPRGSSFLSRVPNEHHKGESQAGHDGWLCTPCSPQTTGFLLSRRRQEPAWSDSGDRNVQR